jgi:hypothetical protein
LKLFLSILTLLLCISAALADTVNVKTAGAVGDGIVNDGPAIQAAINNNPDGTTFYFPAGTYALNSLMITGRNGLTFQGDGASSLVLLNGVSSRIATFNQVANITIQDMAFNSKNVTQYGGVNFYNSTHTLIQRTSFFDSNPRPIGNQDRYSYVFGVGSVPHEDIQILDNTITYLQLEVDFARHVQIRRNTVTRGVKTTCIGAFTLHPTAAIIEDYEVTDNTTVDCYGSHIAFHIDPAGTNGGSIQRIHIAGNTMRWTAVSSLGIDMGMTNVTVASTGNVLKDWLVENNLFFVKPGLTTTNAGFIRLLGRYDRGVEILHPIVRQNVGFGIPAWTSGIGSNSTVDAEIYGNMMVGMYVSYAIDTAKHAAVHDNIAGPTNIAFQSSASRGYNIINQNTLSTTPALKVLNITSPWTDDQYIAPVVWDAYKRALIGP